MTNSQSPGGCGYEGSGKFAPVYKQFTPQTGRFIIEVFGMFDGQGGVIIYEHSVFLIKKLLLNRIIVVKE